MTVAVTLSDQIAELKREMAMRERLYPGWIERGTLRRDAADRQMARTRAALHVLIELQELGIAGNDTTRHLARLRNEEGLP